MNGEAQIIFMQENIKKILFSILIISVLSFSIFLGINYTKDSLASLSSIITAWITINPLEVNLSAPAEVEVNKVFKVEAKVINKGEEKIENAKGEIFLPEGLALLKKDSVQKIGIIPGKKEKKISWSVRGKEIGNYIISVKASGELKGESISTEDSVMVAIKKLLRRTGPLKWFQNFFDSLQKLLGY